MLVCRDPGGEIQPDPGEVNPSPGKKSDPTALRGQVHNTAWAQTSREPDNSNRSGQFSAQDPNNMGDGYFGPSAGGWQINKPWQQYGAPLPHEKTHTWKSY